MTPSIVICGIFLRLFILCKRHQGARKCGNNLHMTTSSVYSRLHIIVVRDNMRPATPSGSVSRKNIVFAYQEDDNIRASIKNLFQVFFFHVLIAFSPSSKKLDLIDFCSHMNEYQSTASLNR